MPLYKEEIHFLVRKDEPIDFIHQIKGRAIWMDMEKSGTYLTALNIYSKLFQERPSVVTPFLNPTATGGNTVDIYLDKLTVRVQLLQNLARVFVGFGIT